MALHKALAGSAMHTPFRWIFADAAARIAQSVAAEDVNKLAWQLSDDTLWVLEDDSPVTWTAVGGSGAGGVTSLNTLVGALTLAAGANITITPSGGNTLTIAATGGGGSPQEAIQRSWMGI